MLALCLPLVAGGCGHYVMFDPKGPIARDELFLIAVSFGLMLLVVIPVIVMAIWFPIKFRAGNTNAQYAPDWAGSHRIEVVVWLIPALIVAILSVLIWKYTHKLDPYKPLEPVDKTVNVQAISLDWKWLFIYPDHNVAVVNQVAFPAKAPVSFKITSATVMTSLFIPQLGSQIYAMAGMQTRLHLLADEPGVYAGQNQQFSGAGYSDMKFTALATSQQDFEQWLQKARQSTDTLTWERYRLLERPSTADTVGFFAAVEPGLYDSIICTFDPRMRAMLQGGHGCMHMAPDAMPMGHCHPEER